MYELRVNWLKAELLDRRGLEVELGHVFDAIRAIIEGTRMTKEEKTDCLAQLMPVKQVLAIIAEKQARLEPITTARVVVNGEDD